MTSFCRRRTPEDLWKKPCCDGAVWNQYSGESTETLSNYRTTDEIRKYALSILEGRN